MRTKDDRAVYCLVNGRRRRVLYAGWWHDHGFEPGVSVDLVSAEELHAVPLGPPCPMTASLNGKTILEVNSAPNLMRLRLAALAVGTGIEFGAGNKPLLIPLESNVRYLDAFSYGSETSKSYPGSRDYSDFMPIDIKSDFERMGEVASESLDFVIASHVIEHSRDPISSVLSCHRVLRAGGVLIMIVPHHDRTFDRARVVTPIEHLMEDFVDRDVSRDLSHYEEWYKVVMHNDDWSNMARDDWASSSDMHHHCFTPTSFTTMLDASQKFGSWKVLELVSPPDASPEFYVVLWK